MDASGTAGLQERRCSSVRYVSTVPGCGFALLTRQAASGPFSHIQVTGLPKTTLPQDVRRLVQTQNLENVSGSESFAFAAVPLTYISCSSIHGLRSLSANRNRILVTILPEFHAPQPANAEQGENVVPAAPRNSCSEPFSCWEDAGFSRPQ